MFFFDIYVDIVTHDTFRTESNQATDDAISSTLVEPTKVVSTGETTLWNFNEATAHSSINQFESKGGHGMMEMQSIQEEKPYIDTRTTPKEITGFLYLSFLIILSFRIIMFISYVTVLVC